MSAESGLRSSGWLKPVLVVSLCLNLAMAGLFGGALIGNGDGDEAQRREPFMLRVLPESRHDEARSMMESARAARDESNAMRSEYEQGLLSAITAEPFEPDALIAAFGSMNDLTVQRRSATQAQIVEIAARMTPEERAQMAERMAAMLAEWAERRRAREAAARTSSP